MALPGGIYCGACDGEDVQHVAQDDEDLDIHRLTLRERLAEGGRLLRRIERYGIRPCVTCGRPSVPGRQYCSSGCRADRKHPGIFEVGGQRATLLQHARRFGLNPSTVYRRLQLGMSPIEALTKPIDETMAGRSRSMR
jgi:hypothetical protein